jgi:regulatory protein
LAPEITEIRYRRGRRNEVELTLDGSKRIVLKEYIAAGLNVGQVVSNSKLALLEKTDQVQRYYERSLRLLSIRPRSESELRTSLLRKGATEDVLNEVVQQLIQQEYIDDEKFAIEWVENRAEFRPRGKRLLEVELRTKGVASEFIANALVAHNEEDAAKKVAIKASMRFAHLPWDTYQKKFVGYLVRRGFQYSLARSLAKISWDEQTSVDESEVDR